MLVERADLREPPNERVAERRSEGGRTRSMHAVRQVRQKASVVAKVALSYCEGRNSDGSQFSAARRGCLNPSECKVPHAP